MKNFEEFKTVIKNEYRKIHEKTQLKTEEFCDTHSCDNLRRNEVYAELFAVEVLGLYHEWLNS